MSTTNGRDTVPARFTERTAQNIGTVEVRVVRDNETGVNYIIAVDTAKGVISVTPLLDQTGEVFIDNIDDDN